MIQLVPNEYKAEKMRKSSISQIDELDSSVSDTKAGKEKKMKSSEGDFNSTDRQNNSLTEVEKKKKSLGRNSIENTVDNTEYRITASHQDEMKTTLSMLGYEGFAWSVDAKDFSINEGDSEESLKSALNEAVRANDDKGSTYTYATQVEKRLDSSREHVSKW